MGRTREFDESDVLARSMEAFVDGGFEGTSIDDLVRATELQRGSLYHAFGSKRGLFLAALCAAMDKKQPSELTTDLMLVALLEAAPSDDEVRGLIAPHVRGMGPNAAAILGRRLLARAQLDTDDERTADQ